LFLWWFPTIQHNELSQCHTDLLSQVCSNARIEPQFQPLSGETSSHRTSNSDDHARLDVSTGILVMSKLSWMSGYSTLCHFNQSLTSCYRRNENEKKCVYEGRIRNVEHGTFTPLVFSVAGGMGPIATTFYKRLASLLADKMHQSN